MGDHDSSSHDHNHDSSSHDYSHDSSSHNSSNHYSHDHHNSPKKHRDNDNDNNYFISSLLSNIPVDLTTKINKPKLTQNNIITWYEYFINIIYIIYNYLFNNYEKPKQPTVKYDSSSLDHRHNHIFIKRQKQHRLSWCEYFNSFVQN